MGYEVVIETTVLVHQDLIRPKRTVGSILWVKIWCDFAGRGHGGPPKIAFAPYPRPRDRGERTAHMQQQQQQQQLSPPFLLVRLLSEQQSDEWKNQTHTTIMRTPPLPS